MQRMVAWWDTRQVSLYISAIVFGGVLGVVAPGVAPTLSAATNPVLAVLLFATFLGVPLIEVGRSFRDLRFLGAVLVLNFFSSRSWCSCCPGSYLMIVDCSSVCSWSC